MSDTITVNINNPIELREKGVAVLKKYLGTVGAIKFIQQFDNSTDNYTEEKYKIPDLSLDEIDKKLKNFQASL